MELCVWDEARKTRAKAMGVYLIDLNEPEGSLGQKLVRIATGEDLP